jgi:hypothetical protein
MTMDASTLPNPSSDGPVGAGYGFSLSDAAGFDAALANGQTMLVPQVANPGTDLSVFVQPISALDKNQADLLQSLSGIEKDMSFSDMYVLMAKFGMHSANVTLVGSIVSKTTEGVQQLFRQQS